MAKYKQGKIKFINPYNFIPVSSGKPVRAHDAEKEADERDKAKALLEDGTDKQQKLHTGYFDCELTAQTPLAIPDADKRIPDKEEKDHYSAYRLDSELTIPGSSLRGVIRSVYETLTNSCMVTLNPKEHITRRSDLGTFKPGVLKKVNGQWVLYEAERIPLVGDPFKSLPRYKEFNEGHSKFIIKTNDKDEKYIVQGSDRFYFGESVTITIKYLGHKKNGRDVWNGKSVGSISKASADTWRYLYLGEMINRKHAESVFDATEKALVSGVKPDEINNALEELEDTLRMYRSPSVNRNLHADQSPHYGYQGYERAKRNGSIPLWYRIESGKLYLSLAAIGRISYHKTMKDLVNGHEPCTDRKSLCPACAVFGMVSRNSGGDESNSLGSLIRITDAKRKKDPDAASVPDTFPAITLKELSSPGISYLPFYSEKAKPYDDGAATIRGRKYYFHNPKAADDQTIYEAEIKLKKGGTSERKTNRNGTYELVPAKSVFSFRVYYENLTEGQVNMLAFALTLGGNDTEYLHKIGHGKPIGLGSAKIRITGKTERIVSQEGYRIEKAQGSSYSEMQKELCGGLLYEKAWELLKKILIFKARDVDIRYPYVSLSANTGYSEDDLKENVLASHHWFSEYKKNGNTLPGLNVNPPTLKSFVAEDIDVRKDLKVYGREQEKSKLVGNKNSAAATGNAKEPVPAVSGEQSSENRLKVGNYTGVITKTEGKPGKAPKRITVKLQQDGRKAPPITVNQIKAKPDDTSGKLLSDADVKLLAEGICVQFSLQYRNDNRKVYTEFKILKTSQVLK